MNVAWLGVLGWLLPASLAGELGPDAYAEPYDASSFLKMPLNALVNAVYPIVGAYWWTRARREDTRDAPYIRAFAAAAIIYGPIQFVRIVTQAPWSAVLDQWVTLPIFAWVPIWVLGQRTGARMRRIQIALMVLSVASYGLVWVTSHGFEITLGLHVLGAVAACLYRMRIVGPRGVGLFAAALVCCAAFIGLKLLDHEVAALTPTPHLSGHFFSKIGDAFQIHFVVAYLSLRGEDA